MRKTPHLPAIDPDKLRTALRRLGDESVYSMLHEAIDLLSPTRLAKLAGRYLDVEQLRPDISGKKSLLGEVRAFDTASRAGEYYESFRVDSKNFMGTSTGTRAFFADCRRLFDLCVDEAPKGDAGEIRKAIEVMLGLLRHIGECHDDVIFFADEGGLWQVGVDWTKVLPALFVCLSRTTGPDEYARRVVEVLNEFDKPGRERHLSAARRVATAPQRKALQSAGAAKSSEHAP